MTELRRRRSTRRPRRARGFDVTNLCLVLAAVLAALPWLFPPSAETPPAPRNAAEAVAARGITVATNHGANR
jgi:hypothetical protein